MKNNIIYKIVKNLLLLVIDLLLLPFYWLISISPRNKNIWVFGSWFGNRYSDNSRMLFEYVNKNCPEIEAIWLSKNKDVVKELKDKKYNVIYSYSLKSFYYLLIAGKAFSTTGNEFPLFFCNGIEFYSLWHGMPLKKILNDDTKSRSSESKVDFRRMIFNLKSKLFPWTYFLKQRKLYTVSNSEFFTPILQSAFLLEESKILRTGSARCDALFSSRRENLIEEIKSKFNNCKILLYMPTFRTSEWTGEYFNPFSTCYGFNSDDFFKVLAEKNIVFLYKPHFYDCKVLDDKKRNNRFITITDDDYDELYNFCGQVDILMTDYSSIYFDFISTSKSVILAPFDYDDYIKKSRAHYFDYSLLEGAKGYNWKDVLKIIEDDSFYPVSTDTKIKFAEYLDGSCCKRIVETIRNI